jgi:hypothetical protein
MQGCTKTLYCIYVSLLGNYGDFLNKFESGNLVQFDIVVFKSAHAEVSQVKTRLIVVQIVMHSC